MTVVDWCQNLAIAILLALVIARIVRDNRVEERTGWLERWAQDKDPEAFGIYPELEPQPAVPECAGPHPVGRDGKTCEVCGLVLVP